MVASAVDSAVKAQAPEVVREQVQMMMKELVENRTQPFKQEVS